MTSAFAQNGSLRQGTLNAYTHSNTAPRTVNKRLQFYYHYLQDVAPTGLTVQHVPVPRDEHGHLPARSPVREEIQLLTASGFHFMTGLVSVESDPEALERTAGDEAYTNWLGGYFAPEGGRWRFFTGHSLIAFFSTEGDTWALAAEFDPVEQADEVAAFLQEEFDELHGAMDMAAQQGEEADAEGED